MMRVRLTRHNDKIEATYKVLGKLAAPPAVLLIKDTSVAILSSMHHCILLTLFETN
jgi:hypothetical protein